MYVIMIAGSQDVNMQNLKFDYPQFGQPNPEIYYDKGCRYVRHQEL